MKRPAFQFYPGDWQRNANLRRCSPAARGVWVDVMCLLHDSDEYGVLRWPLKEVAQAAGASLAHVRELVEKSVLKGSDKAIETPYIYVPRSGRRDGEPVTLIATQVGPLWYSSRMVKDEYVRVHAGASTRFGPAGEKTPASTGRPAIDTERAKLRTRVLAKTDGHCHHCQTPLAGTPWEIDHLVPRAKGGRHNFDNLVPSCSPCNQDKSDTLPDDWTPPSRSPNHSPSRRHGEHQSDGSTSASASTTAVNSVTNVTDSGKPPSKPPPAQAATPPSDRDLLFSNGVPLLTAAGVSEKNARSMLAGLAKTHGDASVVLALQRCADERPVQPVSWLQAQLKTKPGATPPAMNRQIAQEQRNAAVADNWVPPELRTATEGAI